MQPTMLTINNVEKIDSDIILREKKYRIKFDEYVSNETVYFFDIYDSNENIVAYIMLSRIDMYGESEGVYELILKKSFSDVPIVQDGITESDLESFDKFAQAINNELLWVDKYL